jgi:uncharacterized protein YhhL (DUF1145 family)
MDFSILLGGLAAALFGIYADLAFNLFSATNSSPQTTELFAGDRSETLWKYVKIGDFAALAFGFAGAAMTYSSPSTRKLAIWPLIGAVVVIVLMHSMYMHALKAGQAKTGATWKTAGAKVFIPYG